VVAVTVILSELDTVRKVTDLYSESTVVIGEIQQKQEAAARKLKHIEDAGKGIPSLLQI
jgi:hypothetical protein